MTSPLIHALHEPSFWPGQPAGVDVIETHISWVFLAGEFAWKIKKPVRFDFLDFSTLDRRKHFCEVEVELNRRTAPRLYLGVFPITGTPDAPKLDGMGKPIEFAIQMQRFDQDQLFLHLARSGELTGPDIDALASTVAGFHQSLQRAHSASRWGTAEEICAAAEGNFSVLIAGDTQSEAESANRDRLEALASWTADEQQRLASWFDGRKENGFVRECHGDLHLRNIVRYQGRPCLFDCVEFNESFRWIDVMNDLAFLVSDLEDHGLNAFGWRLLNDWLAATGDYAGLTGLPFYLVYRAMVRAKVNALQLRESEISSDSRSALAEEFRGYLDYGAAITQPDICSLTIMHGLSGSGKTTVSNQLIESIGAIRIRSDVERKRLAGMLALSVECHEKSTPPPNLYSGAFTLRTYDRLAELAGTILAAGFPVIVDAAFLRFDCRNRFATLAKEHHVPFQIASCEAPADLLRERLVHRCQKSTDASDADVAVLQLQLENREPLTEDEQDLAIVYGPDDLASMPTSVNRSRAAGLRAAE